jgi:hypothetical protein
MRSKINFHLSWTMRYDRMADSKDGSARKTGRNAFKLRLTLEKV